MTFVFFDSLILFFLRKFLESVSFLSNVHVGVFEKSFRRQR